MAQQKSKEYSYTGKIGVKSIIRMTRSIDPKQIRVCIGSFLGDEQLAGDTIWIPEEDLKNLVNKVLED